MKLHYVKQIEGSPVVEFVANAWCALMRDGQWAKDSVLIGQDLQCVYATEGGEIVGCLTFQVIAREAIVNLAYVLPEMRGRGVYRALHDAFIERAKKQKARYALNICYPSNEGIQKTCEKLGYAPYLLHLKLTL